MNDGKGVVEATLSNPAYAHLKKKAIVLPGRLPSDGPEVPQRHLLLMESCGLLLMRLGQVQMEIKLNPNPDPILQDSLINLYAPLAACSFGQVPSADDFFGMLESDINFWISEAQEINPGWFTWIETARKALLELDGETDKAAEDKKKSTRPSRSASG